MKESARHFVTHCPSCAAGLRVNRKYDGLAVVCKHCGQTFVAIDANKPTSSSSVDLPAYSPDPPAESAERITVLCPSCRATLSVRRVYIGASVKCKQCQQIFPVSEPPAVLSIPFDSEAPALAQPGDPRARIESPPPLEEAPDNELQTRHEALEAEHARLDSELKSATLERDQIRTERDALRAACDRETAAHAAATAELDRYREELRVASSDQASQKQLLAELQARFADLGTAATERDSLRQTLDERTAELAAAATELDARSGELAELHGERSRLTEQVAERSAALDAAWAERDAFARELKEARAALDDAWAERDAIALTIKNERERREAKLDELRRAGEISEQSRRAELDRYAGELTALRERIRQLEEQHEWADRLLAQSREQNQQLIEAHDQARSDYESALASERSAHARLTKELQEAVAASELAARAATQSRDQPPEPTPANETPGADQAAARAEVVALEKRLFELETLNHDMSEILAGLGIRYKPSKLASY
jgi:chromosome segregation ATPase/ribosomal protein L37AE/L43A